MQTTLALNASTFRLLSPADQNKWLDALTEEEAKALSYDWRDFWARSNQVAPPINDNNQWLVWLVLAGRGFGKTRTGAEFVREEVESGRARRIGLIAPTAADARDVMVEGDSGILSICPPWNKPKYEPSKRRLTWPNGAIATLYSADEPERLRGPQHDLIWADELASWRYMETWDMAMFGLRLGNPRVCVTTTPKPLSILRELMKSKSTVKTLGTTYENKENLAAAFFQNVVTKYEGSRLGRQELEAEILDDVAGALWTYKLLDQTRTRFENLPGMLGQFTNGDIPKDMSEEDRVKYIRNCMQRVVVAVDPSGTKGTTSHVNLSDTSPNDVGIVVVGKGIDGHAYILEDLTINASPAVWGQRVVDAYYKWNGDRVVAERNFGGAMVEFVIRAADPRVPYREVHASRGKHIRAEPCASLYERTPQKMPTVHHLGTFAHLETQMTQMTSQGYVGDGSPDRLDAAVWGITELMLASSYSPPGGTSKARIAGRSGRRRH